MTSEAWVWIYCTMVSAIPLDRRSSRHESMGGRRCRSGACSSDARGVIAKNPVKNELRRVVDALPGLVWTTFADGQADFLNRRWCEYTGLEFDQALAHGWQAAIHPDDLPALLTGWMAIVASGEEGELEARLRRFDRGHPWVPVPGS